MMMYSAKKRNVSTFGVIFSIIAGLMIQVLFYNAFEIDIDKLPFLFVFALWALFSTATYFFMKLVEI